MTRPVNPLLRKKDANRRSSSDDGGTTSSEHPHLVLLRPTGYRPAPHHGMWHDDPIHDPTEFTTLNDWPTDEDFEPLISAARRAGDHLLAAQLESDRAFCAAARTRLSAAKPSRDSSA